MVPLGRWSNKSLLNYHFPLTLLWLQCTGLIAVTLVSTAVFFPLHLSLDFRLSHIHFQGSTALTGLGREITDSLMGSGQPFGNTTGGSLCGPPALFQGVGKSEIAAIAAALKAASVHRMIPEH